MNTPQERVVQVRSLGKAYQIDHIAPKSDSEVRRPLSLNTLFNQWGPRHTVQHETFWALRDVDFDVYSGEVFGVVGRNGAGKSTLLKILSRITAPTTGLAEIRGSVGSLLEVGTGFHPELTGRENIFLNGTLLGMKRRQIKQVFEDIVEFAGVERFIDTPVKRYSSGMYVRLAFAVAAHLNPEILILDEVLAVGDMQFQKKCLGKMKDVTGEGRTVLFVSHNLAAVSSLCDRCLLLENGNVKLIGTTEEVAETYFASSESGIRASLDLRDDPPGDNSARLMQARLVDKDGQSIEYANINEKVGIELTCWVGTSQHPIQLVIHVFHRGTAAFRAVPPKTQVLSSGEYHATAWIPARFLNDGQYTVNLEASTVSPEKVHFLVKDRLGFQMLEDIHDEMRQGYVHGFPGVVRPSLHWTIHPA